MHSPGTVAYARVIVDTVDADPAVPARVRRALIYVRLAILPAPTRLAVALVLGLGHSQAHALVPARALLANPHAQLRLAVRPGEAGLAQAAEVTFRVLVARATVAAWPTRAWRTCRDFIIISRWFVIRNRGGKKKRRGGTRATWPHGEAQTPVAG